MRRFLLVLCFHGCSAMSEKNKKSIVIVNKQLKKSISLPDLTKEKNRIEFSPVISILTNKKIKERNNKFYMKDVVKRLIDLPEEIKLTEGLIDGVLQGIKIKEIKIDEFGDSEIDKKVKILDAKEAVSEQSFIVPGYLTPKDSSKSNPSSYSNKSHISPTNSNKDMNDQVMNGGELKKTILTFDANQQQIQEPDNQSQHVMVRVIEHAQNDQNPETIRASFSLSRYLSSCFCFFWCAPYTT